MRLEMMWVKMGWGGGSAELVGRRNNCAALFWIICASVSLCCLKVIRSSFHRQRAFLCMVKVHFSGNMLYLFLCLFFVPLLYVGLPPSQSISLSHSSCLSVISLFSSTVFHPLYTDIPYLWYRTIWRCLLRTKKIQHCFGVHSKVLLISVYLLEQVCVDT